MKHVYELSLFIMAKTGSKKYPHKFKVKALLLYQNNGYNQAQTARQLKITPRTLNNWRKELGDEVFKEEINPEDKLLIPEERKKEITILRNEMMNKEEMFLERVYHARERSIEKGLELIEKERDLKKITDFMRIAHEIITGDHIKSLEERKSSISFFTQINNQFVNKDETDKE